MPDKTKIETSLNLLSLLEDEGETSQLALSRRLSVSVGLVNALLKRVLQKGLVKVKATPRRRWAYYVTPRGFAEKSRLVAEYLESSLSFFRQARSQYLDLFAAAHAAGSRRVILVGGGDLAEIASLAAREQEMDICAVLDRTTNAERLCGVAVVRGLAEAPADALLVLTAMTRPQEVFDDLLARGEGRRVAAPRFLHVVRRNAEEGE